MLLPAATQILILNARHDGDNLDFASKRKQTSKPKKKGKSEIPRPAVQYQFKTRQTIATGEGGVIYLEYLWDICDDLEIFFTRCVLSSVVKSEQQRRRRLASRSHRAVQFV